MNEALSGILKYGAVATGSGLAAAWFAVIPRYARRRNLGAAFTDDEARALIAMAGRPRKSLGTLFSGMGAVRFKARPTPPARTGTIKIQAKFDFLTEGQEALAVEWLREAGHEDKELIGSLLVDLRRAMMRVVGLPNQEDYEFVIRHQLKMAKDPGTAEARSGPKAHQGEASEKNLLYYDTMASGLNSQKAAEKLGLASKGTIEAGAQRAANILDLPWPPKPRKIVEA